MQIDSTGKAGAITRTSDIGLDAGLHLRTRRRSAWNLPVLEEKHRWCCQRIVDYVLYVENCESRSFQVRVGAAIC